MMRFSCLEVRAGRGDGGSDEVRSVDDTRHVMSRRRMDWCS